MSPRVRTTQTLLSDSLLLDILAAHAPIQQKIERTI